MEYTLGIPVAEKIIYQKLEKLTNEQIQSKIDEYESTPKIIHILRYIVNYGIDEKKFKYGCCKDILDKRN